ncbi:polyprenyl synthetase family protein [Mycoplasma sp. P36-A1]|uniref:polyprenyl synthetase family protein n=1 Tax=Mycoplasma sp. P36-A1 TaxID=3252900 RepID=UPI003C2FB0CC
MSKDLEFSQHVEVINELIKQDMNQYLNKNSKVNKACLYAVNAGGKRIRPMLFALLLETYNKDFHNYSQVLSAIEMIHTYSLVHDDLPAMDNDDLRRGKPTVHKQFDEATAILCGDALLTDAFYLLSIANINPDKKNTLMRILSLAAGSNGMIYGQILDLENDNKNNISFQEIEKTYYYKTCLMMEAPLAMAAVICDEDISPFIKLGTLLGQAFQIQDDVLEYTQTSKQIGKSNKSDEINNKQTLTSKIGIDHSNLLIQRYFDEIENIIDDLGIYGTPFHLYIISIANRKK